MLYGKDIICHALPTWEGDYMKAVVQLMAELAKHNRVIYVNYAYTYKDLLGGALGKNNTPINKVLGKEGRLKSKLKFENGELFILYPPPVMPTNFIKSERIYYKSQSRQAYKVGKAINHAQNQLGFKSPIVINAFNPQFGLPLVDKLNESLRVYYCYDEINAAQWCKEHGGRIEQEYLTKVDGVVVTSEGLLASKSTYNSNCFLVKNGVDHSLFTNAMNLNLKSDKVIGYIGSIDDRIDYDLLGKIANAYQNFRIKLIGRVTYDYAFEFESKQDNVELTGAKQPKALAQELKEVDLGLIPFVTNEFTKNIYPLKVNEYLAAGKAVVSTHFASLSEFEKHISIADNHNDFLNAVEDELKNDSIQKQKERNEFAKENSWANRAEIFSQIIDDLLITTSEKS
ncbi:MAG: glycosyltransferase [Bacteroidia bacterium]